MMTDTEMAQLQTLLDDETTPLPIRRLLQMVLKCKDNLLVNQRRVEYLEGLAKDILAAPRDRLGTISRMPEKCPPMPALTPAVEPVEHPIPQDMEDVLYKGAQELGLDMLAPLEAEAYLRGIGIGASKDRELLIAILMVVVGQRIREDKF